MMVFHLAVLLAAYSVASSVVVKVDEMVVSSVDSMAA
jgi:hypothetical protein